MEIVLAVSIAGASVQSSSTAWWKVPADGRSGGSTRMAARTAVPDAAASRMMWCTTPSESRTGAFRAATNRQCIRVRFHRRGSSRPKYGRGDDSGAQPPGEVETDGNPHLTPGRTRPFGHLANGPQPRAEMGPRGRSRPGAPAPGPWLSGVTRSDPGLPVRPARTRPGVATLPKEAVGTPPGEPGRVEPCVPFLGASASSSPSGHSA